jgi:hypothetical protein
MIRYKPPKAIIGHPGVQECTSADAGGAPDYKHDVFLKPGWSFASGRMAGCRSGLFQSVERFRLARPVRD